jgi:putative oxidoreductase
MNTIGKIEQWGEQHHPKWIDIVRFLFGIGYFILGCYYIIHHREIRTMMQTGQVTLFSAFLGTYMILVQNVGGLLIATGLITRVAIIFQLPILLFALISPELTHNILFIYSNLPFTIITTLLMLLFLVEGSGTISLDAMIRHHHPEDL